jgi:hypothetical protein
MNIFIKNLKSKFTIYSWRKSIENHHESF